MKQRTANISRRRGGFDDAREDGAPEDDAPRELEAVFREDDDPRGLDAAPREEDAPRLVFPGCDVLFPEFLLDAAEELPLFFFAMNPPQMDL